MDPGGTTDDAYGGRKAHRALEPPVLTLAPDRERTVAPLGASRRCKRMRAGFHSPPVIARREHDRVHAVHDALVVRGRPVGVELREAAGGDDAIDNLRAREPGGRQGFGRDAGADV